MKDSPNIITVYCDYSHNFYKISPGALYSNTPSDFDFKLAQTSSPLSETALVSLLREAVDIVFPAIHGRFGEDGQLQAFLEVHDIPFVGSSSQSCQAMFHKHRAAQTLKSAGYHTIPSLLLHKENKDLANNI